MRYEIHAIDSADCDSIGADLLDSSDSLDEAKRMAEAHSNRAFGAAILDTETGRIDYGMGFEA